MGRLTGLSFRIGVAIQLACFGLFTIIAIRFNFISRRFDSDFDSRICNDNEKYVTIDGGARKLRKDWRALLRVTNVACGCILVSSKPLHLLDDKISDTLQTDSFDLSHGRFLSWAHRLYGES